MNGNEDNFQRWQSTTIQQLTFATNLLLAMSAASLGFVINLMTSTSFVPTCWSKAFFDVGILTIILSISSGVFLSINRLRDFRITMRIIRPTDGDNQDQLRQKSDRLGNRTWLVFWWQVGTFAVSMILLVISIAIVFRDKLF